MKESKSTVVVSLAVQPCSVYRVMKTMREASVPLRSL